MTEGSISQKIIFFAIPLFLGNLFQQLYNTADSLIVGNFLGSNALAAVSSSGNLIFLMVGFINGIAMGAGVVIARYYGAKKRDCLQKAIHTTVAFGLVAGAALTVLGMLLAPKILVLMGTPADVLPESIVYFRTYFAGSMGVVMYNIFVGVLQSVGDGRHPLIYQRMASITDRLQNSNKDIVHDNTHRPCKICTEIHNRFREHVRRSSHQYQDLWCQKHSQNCQRSTGHKSKCNRCMDCLLQAVSFFGSVISCNNNTCTHGNAVNKTYHQKNQISR